jgi:hypothetical protein
MRLLYVLSEVAENAAIDLHLAYLVREACFWGHDARVLCFQAGSWEGPEWLQTRITRVEVFGTSEAGGLRLPHAFAGDSALTMAYDSMSESDIDSYFDVLETSLDECTQSFAPQLVHTDNVWLCAAMARSTIPKIPIVANARSADLALAQRCPSLLRRVVPLARELDCVISELPSEARRVGQAFGIRSDRLKVISAGLDPKTFGPSRFSVSSELKRSAMRHGLRLPTRASRRVICVCEDSWHEVLRLSTLFEQAGPLGENAVLIVVTPVGVTAPADEIGSWDELSAVHLIEGVESNVIADLMRGCHVSVVFGPPSTAARRALQSLACGCSVVLQASPELSAWPDAFFPGMSLARDCICRIPAEAAYATDGERFDQALLSALERQLGRKSGHMGRAATSVVSRAGWDSVFQTVEKSVYAPLLPTHRLD